MAKKVDNAEIKEQVKEAKPLTTSFDDGTGSYVSGSKEQAKETKPSHEVVTEFRDINDFNTIHEAGKDVSHFTPERLESLVQSGHVKKND